MGIDDDAYLSEEEDLECPLCMEEFDISDRTFKPCPCGYQICRFCYNRIVNSDTANGCPACRRPYSEETVEFKPLTAEEWKRDQQRLQSRKNKEREKRDTDTVNRRHLSNMRVVQKNLVYVIGFSPKSADADLAATLRGSDYFGQYGKINKIVVNKKTHPNGQPTVGVYITYARKEDAAKAIQAVDGSVNDSRVLRASYGTTKYCSAYLRQQICQNPSCMYLHEPGEDVDSYTREDMSIIQIAAKAAEGVNANALAAHHMRRQQSTTTSSTVEEPGLPQHASWASKPLERPEPVSRPSLLQQSHTAGGQAGSQPQNRAAPPPPPPAVYANPIFGNIFRKLTEGNFEYKIEAGLEDFASFPSLFAWSNDLAKRPESPSKIGRHARANSRYAFATDGRTPPPGFVPPGLAPGLQPPGFVRKDGDDFLNSFLKTATGQAQRPQGSFDAEPATRPLQFAEGSAANDVPGTSLFAGRVGSLRGAPTLWSPQARPPSRALEAGRKLGTTTAYVDRWEPSPPPLRAGSDQARASPSVEAGLARIKKAPWEPSPPPSSVVSRNRTPDVRADHNVEPKTAWAVPGSRLPDQQQSSRRNSVKSPISSGSGSPAGSRSPVASTAGSRSPIFQKYQHRRESVLSLASSAADTAHTPSTSIASKVPLTKAAHKVVRIGNAPATPASTPPSGTAPATPASPAAPRKTVPAASIGKTQEQRQAEKKEKLERRAAEAAALEAAVKAEEVVHEAITSRVRKQKVKTVVPRPAKTAPLSAAPITTPADPEMQSESVANAATTTHEPAEQEIEDAATDESATDAIQTLSNEIDLGRYKFFQPLISFARRYTFTEDELRVGDTLLQGDYAANPGSQAARTQDELEAMQDALERDFDLRESRLTELIQEASRDCAAKEEKLVQLLAKNRQLAGLSTR